MASNYQALLPSDHEEEEESRIPTDLKSLYAFDKLGLLDGATNKKDCVLPFQRYGIWMLHALFLTLSTTLFILGQLSRPTALSCVKKYSAWSPADTAVKYERVRYNLTKTRFVGAGPEVDKAWREISYDVGDQWIPESSLAQLDMPASSLKVKHPDTGEDGYRVGMEVFHHLHCLNLLRRVTYKEYYQPLGGEFSKRPEELQRHTDHCVEVLRHAVQCNADIGLFTFYMVPGDPLAWPELNSKHVCRDFESVRRWALDNSVGNMEVLAV